MLHRLTNLPVTLPTAVASAFWLCVIGSSAQLPKAPPKPTERVIQQYETFIADGSLITPDGWKRASRLFVRSDAYPRQGEIELVSTGGLIGEDWVRGDRAQVETKWNDSYGTIDSVLRFKPGPYGSLPIIETYSLAFIHTQPGDLSQTGEWRIDGPPRARRATIRAAIKYVEGMRNTSDDPFIRKNANTTIAELKRLTSACGSASAC